MKLTALSPIHWTDDIQTVSEHLTDKAEVYYGIETSDRGMREFAIFDNNGYMLQFGQEKA